MAVVGLIKGSASSIQKQIECMITETNSAKKQITSAMNGLDFEVASKKNLQSRLKGLKSSTERQATLGKQYKDAFLKVTGNVADTDNKYGNKSNSILDKIKKFAENSVGNIKNLFVKSKLIKYATTAGLFLSGDSVDKASISLWDFAKKAGHIGVFLSLAEAVVKGGAENIAKAVKYGYKFSSGLIKDAKKIGKISRTGVNTKQMWKKKLLGVGDYFKEKLKTSASVCKNPISRWKNNFSKVWADGNKITKSTWIGLALDGVINGVKNYKEFGGITTRAVAETVVETAWDTLAITATTAAVAATMAAVTGGAPVIAVAVGTMAVTSIADAVANWVTGTDDGLTEIVSDTLIDTAEKIGKGIPKAIEKLRTDWTKCFCFA